MNKDDFDPPDDDTTNEAGESPDSDLTYPQDNPPFDLDDPPFGWRLTIPEDPNEEPKLRGLFCLVVEIGR
ncbi:MAG TPA: hypothetical protein VME46_16235 [Acidimicrobiales bacterium]|nr:hypothetical protein [Acidimicrobiales bacterium]